MRVSRIYHSAALAPQQKFAVGGTTHHYLSRVLRLKVGQTVRFFNGVGREFLCEMIHCDAQQSTFICQQELAALPEPKPKIKLYLAVCKNEGMDFAVQKATELGTHELQPLISERSLAHAIADKRRAHWQGIARSACEQCGRAVVPKIAAAITLSEVVAISGDDRGIVFDSSAQTAARILADEILAELCAADATLHLMIGPEGGFSIEESARAVALGFAAAHLGDYTLRSETAVVAALSVMRCYY